jgi:hypothetical protein
MKSSVDEIITNVVITTSLFYEYVGFAMTLLHYHTAGFNNY